MTEVSYKSLTQSFSPYELPRSCIRTPVFLRTLYTQPVVSSESTTPSNVRTPTLMVSVTNGRDPVYGHDGPSLSNF